ARPTGREKDAKLYDHSGLRTQPGSRDGLNRISHGCIIGTIREVRCASMQKNGLNPPCFRVASVAHEKSDAHACRMEGFGRREVVQETQRRPSESVMVGGDQAAPGEIQAGACRSWSRMAGSCRRVSAIAARPFKLRSQP